MSRRQGGAEVEITMLFADVRGSTTLAEGMTPAEFRNLINRFYKATTAVLIRSEAVIDRLVGDEVVGYFVPGLPGRGHASKAIESAMAILDVTGHGDSAGPWIPVGAGVHTGTAFLGTLGSYDISEISRLDIQDRFGTFLAIRWPTGDFNKYNDIIVLQDVFPAIFSYLIQDPKLMASKVEPATLEENKISGAAVVDGMIEGGIHNGEPLFIGGND